MSAPLKRTCVIEPTWVCRDTMPWADHLVCFDGKKDAEHRMLLGNVLTYKCLKQNEEYLHGSSDTLIDRFIANGKCNVVPEFAHATTVYAISDLMGIPMEDCACCWSRSVRRRAKSMAMPR